MTPSSSPAGADPAAGGGPRPGLRERKKERTRRAIQFHTLRLIDEQGYAATTVEQIADAAEISPSTFFRYYRNKDEAAVADIMDEATVEQMLAAPAHLGPAEALSYGVRHAVEALSDEDWAQERLRNRLIQTVPELQRGLMEELARPMRLVVSATAARMGRDPDDPEARVLGGALMGGLIALLLPAEADEEVVVPESREEIVAMLQAGLSILTRVITDPT